MTGQAVNLGGGKKLSSDPYKANLNPMWCAVRRLAGDYLKARSPSFEGEAASGMK
jgi:hypothetical protein